MTRGCSPQWYGLKATYPTAVPVVQLFLSVASVPIIDLYHFRRFGSVVFLLLFYEITYLSTFFVFCNQVIILQNIIIDLRCRYHEYINDCLTKKRIVSVHDALFFLFVNRFRPPKIIYNVYQKTVAAGCFHPLI